MISAVADTVAPTPVAAAGGIADERGLAGVLILGSEAAMIGTRFRAAREALGHDKQKALIERSSGDKTLRTRIFDAARGIAWPEGFAGRAIRNRFGDTWHGRDVEPWAEGESARERCFMALDDGDTDTAGILAGEGTDLISDRPGAGALVQMIVDEAVDALANVPARCLVPGGTET